MKGERITKTQQLAKKSLSPIFFLCTQFQNVSLLTTQLKLNACKGKLHETTIKCGKRNKETKLGNKHHKMWET